MRITPTTRPPASATPRTDCSDRLADDRGRLAVEPSAAGRSAALVGAVIAVDQLTKAVAVRHDPAWVIEPVRNAEYALGVIGSSPAVLTVGTLAAIAVSVLWSRTSRAGGPGWILPLFLGGAVSNVADRVRLGAVRDFLATPWFVFNVADVAILVAVVAFYVALLVRSRTLRRTGRR